MSQVLSFNVTSAMDSQVVDAARDAVMTLHSAGIVVGQHNCKRVSDEVSNVHIVFNAKNALGPRVIRAFQSIRALPNVDAVKTLD